MKNDAKSFIVRIWIDSPSEDIPEPTWRGVIEHVGTNDRQHFHKLDTVTDFISERTGLRPSNSLGELWGSLKEWIRNELRKWRTESQ